MHIGHRAGLQPGQAENLPHRASLPRVPHAVDLVVLRLSVVLGFVPACRRDSHSLDLLVGVLRQVVFLAQDVKADQQFSRLAKTKVVYQV